MTISQVANSIKRNTCAECGNVWAHDKKVKCPKCKSIDVRHGVSKDTIRRWCQRLADDGVQVPSHKMELNEHGTSFVWCYTKSDVKTLESLSEVINPKGGRPPKKEDDDSQ